MGETYYGSEGYNLFYDAPTEQGMSGGPILDENGKFIGIHGRGEKNITKSNFRGYTVKTGVNSGLSSYLIYRLDDFYKNLSPSNNKPEKDSSVATVNDFRRNLVEFTDTRKLTLAIISHKLTVNKNAGGDLTVKSRTLLALR